MVLPEHLKLQTWFEGKTKTIKLVTLKDAIPVPLAGDEAFLAFVQVEYVGADLETYALPLAFATGAEAEALRQAFPRLVIADLTVADSGQTGFRRAVVEPPNELRMSAEAGGREAEGQAPATQAGILYDAFGSALFCKALLELVWHRRRLRGGQGEAEATRAHALRRIVGDAALPEPAPSRIEQRNSSVVFGDKVILKLFRRLDVGDNPELELGQFLTAIEFPLAPPYAGAIEYSGPENTRITLAVLHEFIPNARDARAHTLDALGRYYDRVITWVAQERTAPSTLTTQLTLLDQSIPPEVAECIGTYLESARLLGARTAQLHLALASAPEGEPLAPEPFTPHYQRGLFQSMRSLAAQNLRLLRKQLKALPPEVGPLAQQALESQPAILQSYRQFIERRFAAKRIHIHGDCHLGQVLWTGKDFVFIDFKGEPLTAMSERCIKRSPLRDVATLLRSLHYTAYAGLYAHVEGGSIPQENLAKFESWVRYWSRWVGVAFLKAYVPPLAQSDLLPTNEADVREMLRAYLLTQVISELGQELNQPSNRLRIPLQGILHLTSELAPSAADHTEDAASPSAPKGTAVPAPNPPASGSAPGEPTGKP